MLISNIVNIFALLVLCEQVITLVKQGLVNNEGQGLSYVSVALQVTHLGMQLGGIRGMQRYVVDAYEFLI